MCIRDSYGSAWRILRLPSLTDQIYIKAQRIRSIQNNKTQKIDEGQASEFIGIINYSVMSLIQIDLGVVDEPDMDIDNAVINYKKHIGSKMQVLVEGPSRRNKDRMQGRTRCNRIVVFDGGDRFRGQLVDLNIIRTGLFTLYGDPAILT